MLTAEQVKSACDYYSSLPESDPMRNAYEIIVGLAVVVNSQKRALESQAAPGKVERGYYREDNIVIQCECCKAEIIGHVVRPGKYQYQCAKFCINSEAGKVVAGEGFKARLATAIENVTRTTIQADNGGCDGADVYEATCAQEYLDAILAELTELPAPTNEYSHLENNCRVYFKNPIAADLVVTREELLNLAAALIAAATQPQKGSG